MPRNSKKRRNTTNSPSSHSKEDLKTLLREKLREKQLGRLAPTARDNKLEKLELKLLTVKDNEEQRHKIQDNIDLLKRVRDNEVDNFTGEYGDCIER
jgi:hypothetical protein